MSTSPVTAAAEPATVAEARQRWLDAAWAFQRHCRGYAPYEVAIDDAVYVALHTAACDAWSELERAREAGR